MNHSLCGSFPPVVGLNYRCACPSFCLVQSLSRFLCSPLRAALDTHHDATISFPRLFSFFHFSFFFFFFDSLLFFSGWPSFSTKKVFSTPASSFDLDALHFMGFFDCMVFWRSLFLLFTPIVVSISVPWYCLPSMVGRGQGTRRCDAKIAIHDCLPYRQRDVVLK